MPKQMYVKITKDVDGDTLEGECTEEALPVWEEHGWTVVDDGSSEQRAEVPEEPQPGAVPNQEQPTPTPEQPTAKPKARTQQPEPKE